MTGLQDQTFFSAVPELLYRRLLAMNMSIFLSITKFIRSTFLRIWYGFLLGVLGVFWRFLEVNTSFMYVLEKSQWPFRWKLGVNDVHWTSRSWDMRWASFGRFFRIPGRPLFWSPVIFVIKDQSYPAKVNTHLTYRWSKLINRFFGEEQNSKVETLNVTWTLRGLGSKPVDVKYFA